MKSKERFRIMVVVLIAVAAITSLVVYFLLKKSPQVPELAPVFSSKPRNEMTSRKDSKARIIKEVIKKDSGASEEDGSPVIEHQQTPEEKPVQTLKAGGLFLATDPENVSVAVEEGEKIKYAFKLINNGAEAIPISIYKSELDLIRDEAQAEMEKLQQGALQASVFAGWPWLMLFPQKITLGPGEAKEIQMTVDARTLESDKNYIVYLYAVGEGKEGSLLIPVEIQPKKAPKISLAKVEVDDGFSADTQGDANNVANPNETAAVTVTLENTGNAPAEGLSISVSSADTAASVLGDSVIQVPFFGPHSQFSLRIIIQLSPAAHPAYPPALYLTMTDSQGRKWQESFYAGEPGKFNYPTGLKIEKEEYLKEEPLGRMIN